MSSCLEQPRRITYVCAMRKSYTFVNSMVTTREKGLVGMAQQWQNSTFSNFFLVWFSYPRSRSTSAATFLRLGAVCHHAVNIWLSLQHIITLGFQKPKTRPDYPLLLWLRLSPLKKSLWRRKPHISLKIASFNLRIWQCRPAKPPVQLQTAPAALSMHFPLLVQFRLEQPWEESSRS